MNEWYDSQEENQTTAAQLACLSQMVSFVAAVVVVAFLGFH